MPEKRSQNFLERYGKDLIENGYNIVPILPGSKRPPPGWDKMKSTLGQLREWLENGFENGGVGIVTKYTPAVDLDILDEDVAKQMEAWCLENLGAAPIRVGKAPKRLLLFRTDEPFRKMKSAIFVDEWQDEHSVEILCDGQQFVAYAIHKDTNLPYEWISEEEPANTQPKELTLLTAEQAQQVLQAFEQMAAENGWKKVKSGVSGGARKVDDDDPFVEDESVIDIEPGELRNLLMVVPGSDDYDTWFQVGMALYHQFDGDETGLELWHEWSELADNYDAEALDEKWGTFDIDGKRRAPVTARTIIKMAKEAQANAAVVKVQEFREAFKAAKDVADWKEVCKQVTRSEIDSVARSDVATVARQRYQEITGSKVPISEIRRALAYQLPTKGSGKVPRWCKPWVYDSSDDKFFNVDEKVTVTTQGFNAIHDRQALTQKDIVEGKTSPSSSAADLALNVYQIPVVHGRMYSPGRDTLFTYGGVRMANLYPENQVPEIPEKLRPLDKRNINRVKAHIEHLLEDETEQRYLLDWLAFVVQNPGKRVNWSILLQGTEGDGKSFFAFLLRAAMGMSNVRMVNASTLESPFNDWSHGQCVIAIEEVRLQGHNRYDVINRLKPLITNDVIEIHPKGKAPYNVDNTSNYLLFTNYRDALPLLKNDRRFCVMFSRWQSRVALEAFMEEQPDYYRELYAAIAESGPALRKWLLEHEIHEDFPIGGKAPRTKAHEYMVQASMPQLLKDLNEIVVQGLYATIAKDLVSVTELADAIVAMDGEIPKTQSLSKALENNGYMEVGRVRIGDRLHRFWSETPERFMDGAEVSQQAVRSYVDKRQREIDTRSEL